MKKQPYDIFVGESYEHQGETRKNWYRAGVAFELKGGGFSCRLPNGLALTGEFIIKKREPKDNATG